MTKRERFWWDRERANQAAGDFYERTYLDYPSPPPSYLTSAIRLASSSFYRGLRRDRVIL